MSLARATGTPMRHLVLLGAGPTHLALARRLAGRPLPAGLPATWLVHADSSLPLERVADCIEGSLAWPDARVALEPLARRAGLRLLVRPVQSIDGAARAIALDGQERLAWDLLSVDPQPEQDRAQIETEVSGARANGLFVCPPERLEALWPQVCALPPDRRQSAAVIGAGPLAIGLLLALRRALPQSALSLVTPRGVPWPGLPDAAQAALARRLRRAAIDVLPGPAIGIGAGSVQLAHGASLRCQVPLVLQGLGAPRAYGLDSMAGDPDPHPAPAWAGQAPEGGVLLHPPTAAPGQARRLHAALLRAARGQPLRMAPPRMLRWPALRTGPGQAWLVGARWQLGGAPGAWLRSLFGD